MSQRHIVTETHRHRDTKAQSHSGHIVTERYRVTGTQSHRDTEIQRHRVTGDI